MDVLLDLILFLVGTAFGAGMVAMKVYGNVGEYYVAEGDDLSGWVHDGILYVPDGDSVSR